VSKNIHCRGGGDTFPIFIPQIIVQLQIPIPTPYCTQTFIFTYVIEVLLNCNISENIISSKY